MVKDTVEPAPLDHACMGISYNNKKGRTPAYRHFNFFNQRECLNSEDFKMLAYSELKKKKIFLILIFFGTNKGEPIIAKKGKVQPNPTGRKRKFPLRHFLF